LIREDGNEIVFSMVASEQKGKQKWVIYNASERITVDSIIKKGDSLFVEMPLFDSRMRLHVSPDKTMTGTWTRAITAGTAVGRWKKYSAVCRSAAR